MSEHLREFTYVNVIDRGFVVSHSEISCKNVNAPAIN